MGDTARAAGAAEWVEHRALLDCYLQAGAIEEAGRLLGEIEQRRQQDELHLARTDEVEFRVRKAEILLGGIAEPQAQTSEEALREAGRLIDVLRAYDVLARLPALVRTRVVVLEVTLFERRGESRRLLHTVAAAERDPSIRNSGADWGLICLAGGRAAQRAGMQAQAERLFREALAEASLASDTAFRARALQGLGCFLLETQRAAEALPLLISALETQFQQGRLGDTLPTRMSIARLWERRGMMRESLAWYREATRLAGSLEQTSVELEARLAVARLEIRLHRNREARAALIACVQQARRLRTPGGLVRAYGLLAAVHVREGQPEKARVPLGLAERVLIASELPPAIHAEFALRRAEYRLAAGAVRTAREAVRRARVVATRHRLPSLATAARCLEGEVLLAEGHRADAIDSLREAYAAVRGLEEAYLRGLVEVALGKALVAGEETRAEGIRIRTRGIHRLRRAGVPVDALDQFRLGPVAFRTCAHLPCRPPLRARLQPDRDDPGPARWARFGIITHNGRFHAALLHASRVAPTQLPVLVLGETGSGKEVVARAVHQISERRGHFVVFNAATCQNDLFEAELFGHRRGAFTGAHRDRPGVIAQAHGGTLFLDEVADLSLGAQAALLRFLDRGEVRPLGADVTRRVNARIVAATHRPLRHLVEGGRFRQDLFYRLAGVEIQLPPLRSRPEDVVPLVLYFAAARGVAADVIEDLLDEGLAARLLDCPWPGNVRQLSHWVDQLIALLRGEVARPRLVRAMERALGTLRHGGRVRASARRAEGAASGEGAPVPSRDDLVRLLKAHRGNISAVAHDLHTYRTRVYRMLRARGIDYRRYRVRRDVPTSPPPDRR